MDTNIIQNPSIIQLCAIIINLSEQVQSLKKQMKDEKYLSISLDSEQAITEIATRECTIDILEQQQQYNVYLWMIEWAMIVKDDKILKMLLDRYFKGVKVELSYLEQSCHCQIIWFDAACSNNVSEQHKCQNIRQCLHVIYEDEQRYKQFPLPLINKNIQWKGQLEGLNVVLDVKEVFVYHIIELYFKLKIQIKASIYDRRSIRRFNNLHDHTIIGFRVPQYEGDIVTYGPLKGMNKIYCKDSKLCLKSK